MAVKSKLKTDLEARIGALEATDTPTDEEQQELDEAKAALAALDGDDGERDGEPAQVPVTIRVPANLFSRARDAAKDGRRSFNKTVVLALDQFVNNGGQAGAVPAHQDLRDLCDLAKMHKETSHPQVKAEISERVKREYGIDLNRKGSNVLDENDEERLKREFWDAYQGAKSDSSWNRGEKKKYATRDEFEKAEQSKPAEFKRELKRWAGYSKEFKALLQRKGIELSEGVEW